MEEWKEYRLGDVVNILDYKRIPLSSKERSTRNGLYPYYGAQGIIDYIDDYIFDGTYLLIAEDGENLKSHKQGISQIAKGKFWVNNHAHILESNGKSDIRYICYLLNSIDISGYITGSAQPKLNQENLRSITIKLPSLTIQTEIADFLSKFDYKIDLNRKINSNLEEQAKALFKSWFIDFDPFKDGKFIDSELGMIPEGWKVVTIGEVTDNIKEKVGDRDSIKVLSPVTSGHLVLSEEYFSKQVFSSSIAKYIVVKHNDFAYNPARINIGSIGMNEFEFDGCVSPVYVVFRCQSGYEYFFDLYRRTSYFIEEVKKRAIGGVRQTLSYKDLSLIQLIYPPKKVVDAFNFIYISFIHGIHSNDVSNKKLEAIRDTLLPKLMSGEIDVK
jgi:type I restriction enzyme S subunit